MKRSWIFTWWYLWHLLFTSIEWFMNIWFIWFYCIFEFWWFWFLLRSWHWRVFLTFFRKGFACIIRGYFLLLCLKSWLIFILFQNGRFLFLSLLVFVFDFWCGLVEFLNDVISKIEKFLIALYLRFAVLQILVHLFVHLPQFLGLGNFIKRYFGFNSKQKYKIHVFSIWKFEFFTLGIILHQSRLLT